MTLPTIPEDDKTSEGNAVSEIAPVVGIVLACATLAVARASYYRTLRLHAAPLPRRTPPRDATP